jgi:hypothetical protein
MFSFENNSGESVEQSTEFLTERIKDGESKGGGLMRFSVHNKRIFIVFYILVETYSIDLIIILL